MSCCFLRSTSLYNFVDLENAEKINLMRVFSLNIILASVPPKTGRCKSEGQLGLANPNPNHLLLCCEEFYSSPDELYSSPGHPFFRSRTLNGPLSTCGVDTGSNLLGCIDADFRDHILVIVGKLLTRSTSVRSTNSTFFS